MILDGFNINQLRVFQCVFKERSMTVAAQELHLTQSGISQHIKSLEEFLGVTLFDRVKQKLVPTSAAKNLYESCQVHLIGIEKALSELKTSEDQLVGQVSIGMPIEFGNNLLLPLISQFCLMYPRVNVQILMGFATEMSPLLLSGDLDFAFVDSFAMDNRLQNKKVYDEVLYMVASKNYIKKSPVSLNGIENKEYFEKLEYIAYQQEAPVLREWLQSNGVKGNIQLNIRAQVMDVQGVARFICNDLGAGVIPEFLYKKLLKDGHKLHRFKGAGKRVHNTISVCFLKERTWLPAADELQKFLNDKLSS